MITTREEHIRGQVRGQVRRWKRMVRQAARKETRDYLVTMWAGYLNGLRIAGAVSNTAYGALYQEMKHYVEGLEDAGTAWGGGEWAEERTEPAVQPPYLALIYMAGEMAEKENAPGGRQLPRGITK